MVGYNKAVGIGDVLQGYVIIIHGHPLMACVRTPVSYSAHLEALLPLHCHHFDAIETTKVLSLI